MHKNWGLAIHKARYSAKEAAGQNTLTFRVTRREIFNTKIS